MPTRFAKVPVSARTNSMEMFRRVERFLPSNYRALAIVINGTDKCVLIEGEDNAGWTLDDYVIPRLGSGLIFCEEITEAELPDLLK